MQGQTTYRECISCRAVLPLKEGFYEVNRQKQPGIYYNQCKQCKNKRVRFLNNLRGTPRYSRNRFKKLKARSESRGWDFDLTIEFVHWLYTDIKKCEYCGCPCKPTFDRKDNNIGYVRSNLVIACLDCNMFRSNKFTYEEMLILGDRLRQIWIRRATIANK